MSMPIPGDLNTRWRDALIEGQGYPDQPGLVIYGPNGEIISGGSSAGMGGQNIWSNVAGDFVATANVNTKTITLSSYASTVLSSVLSKLHLSGAIVKRINSAGEVDMLPMGTIAYSSNVITLSEMEDNFATGDTVAVFIPGPDKAYDQANDFRVVNLGGAICGEDGTLQVLGTLKKPVSSGSYSGLRTVTFGTDIDQSAKGTPGNVLSFFVSNVNAALRYFQIFNQTAAPVNPNVPIFSFPIAAGSATVPGTLALGEDFFGEGGYYCDTGIAWGVSTTNATYTAATAADHNVAFTCSP